jgi:hypothetical protein
MKILGVKLVICKDHKWEEFIFVLNYAIKLYMYRNYLCIKVILACSLVEIAVTGESP